MIDMNHYIRRYDNFFPDEYCDLLVSLYEKVWAEEQEKIKATSLCGGCYQCSCNRIDIMQHDLFAEHRTNIALAFDKMALPMYKRDTGMEEVQFPVNYSFENIKIKKYTKDTDQQFKDHVDVGSIESAKRFLIFMVYLNEDFEGGETVFNQLDLTIKPKKGTLLMFPPFWTYLHHANKVSGNESKYFLGSYLHYIR